MRIEVSIIDYLGKVENGILTLINITFKDKCYDGTFFYTQDQILLTVDDSLIEDLGHSIELDVEYDDLLLSLISSAEPYENIINQIEEFNPQS